MGIRITHYRHACVLLETGSARLLFDPGAFSSGFEELRDLNAVVFTHQHHDHIDLERLPDLLAANPAAELVADHGTVEQLEGYQPRSVAPSDHLDVGGASLDVVGGEHAVMHPDIPTIPNTGFVVDHGAFYHPGDSFHVPQQRIDVLGLPTGAPWLKASEAVDFLRAVAPRVAVPIHEAVLSMPELHYGMFERLGPAGTQVRVLEHAAGEQL